MNPSAPLPSTPAASPAPNSSPSSPATGVGTESATRWERLDTPASTPSTVSPHTTAAPVRPLRLRRSRSQVLGALDGGGSMLQRRGRDILVGSSLLLLPVVALNLWATTVAFDRTGATRLTAFGGDDVGTGIEDVAAVLAALCASLAAAIVGTFAASILLADRFGSHVGLVVGLRTTVRRLPTVVVVWAVGHIWLPFAATWTLASPSDEVAGRLTLVLPAAALLSCVTLLAVPVLVAERTGPLRALRRSARLAKLRFGSAFGFVISSTLLGGLLFAGIAFLPTLAEAAGFITFGDSLWLVQGITSQLAVIVVVPLIALGTAELYIGVRIDAEGMDLALDADAAFGRGTRQ